MIDLFTSFGDSPIISILTLLGTAIAGFFTLLGTILGTAKIIEIRTLRRHALTDKQGQIHETNQGKQIDADIAAFAIVAERLKIVEARLDKLQDELTSQREMNAKKDAKIEYLERDNLRLQALCTTQHNEIAALRAELDALKLLVLKNGEISADHPFPVTIIEDEA